MYTLQLPIVGLKFGKPAGSSPRKSFGRSAPPNRENWPPMESVLVNVVDAVTPLTPTESVVA